MVTIYALINPKNGLPFYVGKTTSIEYRVSMHSSDFMRRTGNSKDYTIKRDKLFKQLKQEGLTVGYLELLKCPVNAAAKCEQYIVDLLIKNGYILLQRKKCG